MKSNKLSVDRKAGYVLATAANISQYNQPRKEAPGPMGQQLTFISISEYL